MRASAPLLAFLLLLAPGCLDGGGDPAAGTATATETTAPEAPLPEAIHASQAVSGSADPTNAVAQCMAPTAQCFDYPFVLEGDADVSVALTWGLPASDFDLYLYEGDTQVASSAAGATTEEAIQSVLGPGSYVVVVDAYSVAQDTFTLDITFA